MTKLRQVEALVKFYFAPWGAAKGEVMEAVFDLDLDNNMVEAYIKSILDNSFSFSDEDLAMMAIVYS